MDLSFFNRNKQIIGYGLALAVLMLLLKWLELHFIIVDNAYELYAGALAIFFTALGIWLALKIARPKTHTVILEKPVYINSDQFVVNELEIARLNISKRELEVLELMAQGLSNVEIADRLFVSVNTVKTHSANLFDKLEVKRRTQAVETAKRLGIIA